MPLGQGYAPEDIIEAIKVLTRSETLGQFAGQALGGQGGAPAPSPLDAALMSELAAAGAGAPPMPPDMGGAPLSEEMMLASIQPPGMPPGLPSGPPPGFPPMGMPPGAGPGNLPFA